MAAMFIARESNVVVPFTQARITFVHKNVASLADAEVSFSPHAVDLQGSF
jgi:hypothetical protein